MRVRMDSNVGVDLEAFGRKIRDRRNEFNMSTGQLAELSGLSATRINQIENNAPIENSTKVRHPKPGTVRKLARALSLDEAELLALAGYNVQPVADKPSTPVSESERERALLNTLWNDLDPERKADLLAITQALHRRQKNKTNTSPSLEAPIKKDDPRYNLIKQQIIDNSDEGTFSAVPTGAESLEQGFQIFDPQQNSMERQDAENVLSFSQHPAHGPPSPGKKR